MAQYIKRSDATDALINNTQLVGGDIQEAVDAICSIPAADVRPVLRGKWENTGSDVWKCSACGYGIMPWNAGVNYCPNCGAMMEES